MMRVLWLTNMIPSPRFGFRGSFVAHALAALRRQEGIEADLELIAQDKGKSDYLLANPRVLRLWSHGRYDLVHVHYGLTGLATLWLPPSAPLIFTMYGDDINLPKPFVITRWVAARAARRLFVSNRMAEKWPSERNVILPNGVDFGHCRPADRNASCRKLGLDVSRKWILFGGSPTDPVKGYEVFTEVVARVKARIPNALPLVLTQPGQDHSTVIDKMNAADVLLFTSRQGREGSPTVIKEALVVGLPVVSVDVGDVPELLEGVHPGSIVPWPIGSRDGWIEDLATKVLEVLSAGTRANGRALRPELDQNVIAERTVEIYQDALGVRVKSPLGLQAPRPDWRESRNKP
jgi:teichuronic acid biosynthesis glycosyltransferase TuaC